MKLFIIEIENKKYEITAFTFELAHLEAMKIHKGEASERV